MLRATRINESSTPGTDWESHFTTMTLMVHEEGVGRSTKPAQAPAAVVAAFHAALASGDRFGALSLLAPELVVFEAGDGEMSRDAYASEHLDGDLEFTRTTKTQVLEERSGESGDAGWVLRRTETAGSFGGKPVASRDTATFLLRRTAEGWRITHVHWSSHSVKK